MTHGNFRRGGGDGTMDFLKLNYIASVVEHGERREAFFDDAHFQCSQFYETENVIRNCKLKKSPRVLDVPPEIIMDAPFPAPPIETQSALQAYDEVLRSGGASLPTRDLITEFIANSVRKNTGNPAGKTDDWPSKGYPVYKPALPLPDDDHDGMSDEWELRYKLNPRDASDAGADPDRDGYTNIEEYINGTDPTQFVDYRNLANNHDPHRAR